MPLVGAKLKPVAVKISIGGAVESLGLGKKGVSDEKQEEEEEEEDRRKGIGGSERRATEIENGNRGVSVGRRVSVY